MKALITGASSGIGRDIARELNKRGIDLILVARNKKKLEELKKDLNVDVQIICKDLSINDNCIDLYNEVEDVDILINNAGFGIFGEFQDIELEKELKLINTNICAVHILTKLFIQDMIKRDNGYILNVASIAGFLPGPLMTAYYASKTYGVKLTEGIYEELRRKKSNVKISCLCPGPVKTNFNNVAGVKFSLKSLTSEHVARYAIEKMFKGKLIILPGTEIKLTRFFSKITPDKLLGRITYKMQKRKIEKF